MIIIIYIPFIIYIISSLLIFLYDIIFIDIKQRLRPEAKIIHAFIVWFLAIIEMIILYELGLCGIKLCFIPDIIIVIFFYGISVQIYTIYSLIKRRLRNGRK